MCSLREAQIPPVKLVTTYTCSTVHSRMHTDLQYCTVFESNHILLSTYYSSVQHTAEQKREKRASDQLIAQADLAV